MDGHFPIWTNRDGIHNLAISYMDVHEQLHLERKKHQHLHLSRYRRVSTFDSTFKEIRKAISTFKEFWMGPTTLVMYERDMNGHFWDGLHHPYRRDRDGHLHVWTIHAKT